MKKIISLGLVFGAAPLLAAAAVPGTFDYVLEKIVGYVNVIVPVLITVAIAYFIWGVIQFISSSEEEAKKNGRTKIINGLIGLFVIVAFWGIIALVKNTFGVQGGPATGSDIINNGSIY